ncbi:hypothetical protein ACQEVM_08400 [Streptomyces sp. CA-243310]|uniref:hypothetical protein n=1 Tax=Streptomyces sp. CA-243310 TaxID=3240056 RepID=UPI003D8D0805
MKRWGVIFDLTMAAVMVAAMVAWVTGLFLWEPNAWFDDRAMSMTATMASTLVMLRRSMAMGEEEKREKRRGHVVRSRRPKFGARLTRGTAFLAAKLAGERRSQAWRADFDGHAESGHVLSPKAQRRHAFGLLVAAMKMRLRDLVRPLWAPVDWLLRSNIRTNGFITAIVGSMAIYIQWKNGLNTLLLEGSQACGLVGAGVFGLTRWLRTIRGIEPPEADRPEPAKK